MLKKVKVAILFVDNITTFVVGSASLLALATVGTVSSNYMPETKKDWLSAIDNVGNAAISRINSNYEKIDTLL